MCFLQATDSWVNLLVQSANLSLYIHELMTSTFKVNTERSLLIPAISVVIFLIGWVIVCSFLSSLLVVGVC